MTILSRHGVLLLMFCLIVLAPGAWMPIACAQYEQPYGLPIEHLQPIEERVGDVGPLSTSLREIYPGLAVPSGFQQVYRVPGRDDVLMRLDGGVVAVFPRSEYERTDSGVVPVVPAGTVFYIGLPQTNGLADFSALPLPPVRTSMPMSLSELPSEPVDIPLYDFNPGLPPGARAGVSMREVRPDYGPTNVSAPIRVTPDSERVENRVSGQSAPAIVADGEYRASRVRTLLQRAAQSREQHP